MTSPEQAPATRPEPEPPPGPERAQLLEELTRVEHELAALTEYREQLRERLEGMRP